MREKLPVRKAGGHIPHHTVTAAVIHRDSKVLITQRPPDRPLGGLWEFPGGKVEKDETLHQSLAREIKEELGTEISIGHELGVYHHAYTHFKITLHAFQCRLSTGEPDAIEASDLRWVSPEDLDAYPMGKIDRQIVHRIQKSEYFGLGLRESL